MMASGKRWSNRIGWGRGQSTHKPIDPESVTTLLNSSAPPRVGRKRQAAAIEAGEQLRELDVAEVA